MYKLFSMWKKVKIENLRQIENLKNQYPNSTTVHVLDFENYICYMYTYNIQH